jgi:hypothetical protein
VIEEAIRSAWSRLVGGGEIDLTLLRSRVLETV